VCRESPDFPALGPDFGRRGAAKSWSAAARGKGSRRSRSTLGMTLAILTG